MDLVQPGLLAAGGLSGCMIVEVTID